MTRSMSDISDDENSLTFGSSVMETCNAMDDAERAVAVATTTHLTSFSYTRTRNLGLDLHLRAHSLDLHLILYDCKQAAPL